MSRDSEPKKISRNSTVFVNRTIGSKPEDPAASGEEEILGVHEFATSPAVVDVGVALTMNLGNFESAKISVNLSLPCYAEEVDKAYVWAQRWVEERIGKERDQIAQYRRSGGRKNPL